MGFLARVFFVLLSLGIAVLYQNYRNISRPYPVPKFDVNEYWGPGSVSSYKEDPSIKPFTIKYVEEIETLKQELSRPLKLHEPLEGVGFEYGFNSKTLKNVIAYWRDNYLPRWSQREQFLNKFPQFTTQVQGLKIHFIHVKPKKVADKTVIPLLLLHGWPGSVREFYEIIPLLTTPSKDHDFVFELVVPSLPGYGWSQGSAKKNLGTAKMAVIFHNLMLRLGYKNFLIQGGDWGSAIGSHIALIYPGSTIGFHANMCSALSMKASLKLLISSLLPTYFFKKDQIDFHLPLGDKFSFMIEESGYFHLQATKPDTIGAALLNNPVGLVAYILEKFSTWTNPQYRSLPDGGLEKRFSLDALLDNIMIYYLTDSITTSQRLYAEHFGKTQRSLMLDHLPITVPVGCARFKNDLMHSTDWQLKDRMPLLKHSSYHSEGGHFAALEVPHVLYSDFIEFVKKIA